MGQLTLQPLDIHRLWLSSSLDTQSDEVYDQLLSAVPCFSGVVVKANGTHKEQIRKAKSSTGYASRVNFRLFYIHVLSPDCYHFVSLLLRESS